MSRWHFDYKDELIFKEEGDPRNGEYFVYNQDTFDYLVNDMDWVFNNDAFDEHSWIIDNLDNTHESYDGRLIYIPTGKVSMNIEAYYELDDQVLY